MVKNMKKKIISIFLLVLIFTNILNPFTSIYAAINEKYSENLTTAEYEFSNGSLVLRWVAEIAFNFASAIERIGARIVKIFTGQRVFPWMDKVIFNTIPILDVNFINPASGSFFEDVNGNMTKLGNIIRNTYFTVLSICLGFVVLIIGIMSIRLAISSIASEKAKCKEAIINFGVCLVLIFGMHFLLAFLFSVNETMVELASFILTDKLSETSQEIINKIDSDGDADNKQLLDNFIKANDDKCFISSIPIIGAIWDGLRGFVQGIANALGKVWAWLTGNQSDEDECDIETLKKVYPKRQDYVDGLKSSDTNINVAAYMLKDKFYRTTYFKWTSGTDANNFNEAGIGGVLRNIAVTANDIFGVADTGYKSIRSLYTSTMFVTFVPDGTKLPYETTQNESYNNLSDEEKKKYNEADGHADSNERKKFNVDKSSYLTTMIHSTKDYLDYMEQADTQLQKAQANNNQNEVVVYTLSMLYAEAYYKYVYQGDDKIKPTANEFFSELGQYFKETSFYVDLESGDWAPDTVNVISAIIYSIFVIQSLLFFIAYIKRFFYVIILSMLGPAVVVFDFLAKAI